MIPLKEIKLEDLRKLFIILTNNTTHEIADGYFEVLEELFGRNIIGKFIFLFGEIEGKTEESNEVEGPETF